jgi:hypothetical protein
MVRPALTFGCSAWYTPAGLHGAKKGTQKVIQAIQGKFLRLTAGAYRATSTEALEVETHTLPLDLYLEKLIMQAHIRTRGSQVGRTLDAGVAEMKERL